MAGTLVPRLSSAAFPGAFEGSRKNRAGKLGLEATLQYGVAALQEVADTGPWTQGLQLELSPPTFGSVFPFFTDSTGRLDLMPRAGLRLSDTNVCSSLPDCQLHKA